MQVHFERPSQRSGSWKHACFFLFWVYSLRSVENIQYNSFTSELMEILKACLFTHKTCVPKTLHWRSVISISVLFAWNPRNGSFLYQMTFHLVSPVTEPTRGLKSTEGETVYFYIESRENGSKLQINTLEKMSKLNSRPGADEGIPPKINQNIYLTFLLKKYPPRTSKIRVFPPRRNRILLICF